MSMPSGQFSDQVPPYPPSLAHSLPKKKQGAKLVLLILGIVGGSSLLLCLGCGGLAYLGMKGVSHRQPTAREEQAVFTMADLEAWGVEQTKLSEREEWNAKKNFDGSLEIEYEYDPEKSGDDDAFSLISSVEINPTEKDARESFGMAVTAYSVGLKIGGTTSQKQEIALPWADQSHFALIQHSNITVGNMAVIRKGKRLHAIVLIGHVFENPAELAEAMRPKVEVSAGLTNE